MSSVQTSSTTGPTTKLKPGAIVQAQDLEQTQGWLNRGFALVLWLITCSGEIIAFAGGWAVTERLTWNLLAWNWIAVTLGIGLQLILTYVQWAFARRRLSPQWLLAFAFSTGPNVFAFYPPLAALFLPALTFLPEPLAIGVVSVVIVCVLGGADIIPEHLMIEG